jgi:hypothetical protein
LGKKEVMKNKLIYPIVATVLLTGAACRGDRTVAAGQQQQFETVQEGSAAGVTSTIHGPGETVPPMTGTNADTTTAFALNPNAAPAPAAQPGTIAGTLPAQSYPTAPAPSGTYTPSQPVSRPAPSQPIHVTRQPQPAQRTQPVPVQPQQPEVTPQQPTETVEPVPQQPPSQTDTTATQPPPPAPTQTAPPSAQQQPKPKKEQKPPAEESEPAEEDTDTAEPPPPPPPM